MKEEPAAGHLASRNRLTHSSFILHPSFFPPRHPSSFIRHPSVRGFTLIEMLTVVAGLIILLGLMVSLAWDVRRQSSERLTKDLLAKLEVLMRQYVDRHTQLPEVTPLIPDENLLDEDDLLTAAGFNSRDFVLALQAEAAGPSPELFGPLAGSMYDEVTLRDAWGTPIVFMPRMHPAIGMALGDRPFFFSAGPDRKFLTLEDNLYSYEQGSPESTDEAIPAAEVIPGRLDKANNQGGGDKEQP